MPLNCDCYAGCWKEHSNSWPKIMHTESILNELYFRCVKILPRGTYVLVKNELRLEKLELFNKIGLWECN